MSVRILLWLSLLAFPFISPGQTLIDHSLETDFKMGFQDALQLEDGSIIYVITGTPASGFDSTQSVLMKVDTALNVLWTKRYKGYNRDDFASITQLADGNILVTGTVRTPALAPEGGAAFKMDTAGNIIWYNVYDDSFDDRIIAAFEQADNSLVLIDRKGVTNTPTKILHTTNQGSLLFTRAYEDENAQGLVVDEAVADGQGNYYLIGDRTNNGQPELVVLAITDSSLKWTKAYDFGRPIFATDAICDSMGKLIVSASIEDTSTFLFTFNTVLMEVETDSGELVWAEEINQDQPYTNSISDIKFTEEKHLVGCGLFGTDEGTSSWAFEADTAGNLVWTKAYYQFETQSLSTLLRLADGRLLMAGNADTEALLIAASDSGESSCSDTAFVPLTQPLTAASFSPTYTSTPPVLTVVTPTIDVLPISISDSLICKRVLAATTHVHERKDLKVRLYPNPSNSILTVEWRETSPAKLELYSLEGQLLQTASLSPQQTLDLSLNYPKGIYFLKLISGERVLTRKIIRE